MRLLNVSTGRIRTVRIGGEEVRTAHVKTPAPEPWLITDEGAAGDERAVHPDKLYAFPRSHYDYWGKQLGVDPADWPDGFFGENLTFDTLDEDDVALGDVFELGDEVRLVVSGSRTPCVKLAWRLGQPRTFQRVFALSRRTGAYFGVLRPGRVRPGDVLRRVEREADLPSIAELCRFVADRDPPPLEPLRRVLAFKRLSPTIRLLLGAKRDAAERAATAREGGWPGWRPFHVSRIVEEAADVRSFELRPADGGALRVPKPGQHVAVRLRDPDGAAVTRAWSLSAYAHDMDRYRLTVRRQTGQGSTRLHALQEGDRVELRSPSGGFALDQGGYRPLVLVAAGIGVTPLMAMLQAHLLRPGAAPAWLIYGARTPDDVVFRSDLQAMAAAHPALTTVFKYSRTDEGDAGRIDADFVIGTLHDLHVVMNDHRIALPWYEGDMYLCGPGAFCETLKAELVARGGNADHIAFETFAAPPPEDTDVERAVVRFQRSGVVLEWRADAGESLLDLADAAGLSIPNDCRAGACRSCRTRVISGACTASAEGEALLCIALPLEDELVLDA